MSEMQKPCPWAPDPFTMNTLAKPNAIQREIVPLSKQTVANSFRRQVRPWPFTEVIVE